MQSFRLVPLEKSHQEELVVNSVWFLAKGLRTFASGRQQG